MRSWFQELMQQQQPQSQSTASNSIPQAAVPRARSTNPQDNRWDAVVKYQYVRLIIMVMLGIGCALFRDATACHGKNGPS